MPSVTDNRILNCILFKNFNFLVPQKKKKRFHLMLRLLNKCNCSGLNNQKTRAEHFPQKPQKFTPLLVSEAPSLVHPKGNPSSSRGNIWKCLVSTCGGRKGLAYLTLHRPVPLLCSLGQFFQNSDQEPGLSQCPGLLVSTQALSGKKQVRAAET